MTGKLAPVWFHVTDLEVIKGEGVFVYTPNGDKYLDCTSGIAVTSTGIAIRMWLKLYKNKQVNLFILK